MTEKTIDYSQHKDISTLLAGRRVTKVADDTITLDDGRKLRFDGTLDCCAGYDVTELNSVDNIITSVEFLEDPTGDDYPAEATGTYKIFVYADNRKINLVTLRGSDGTGYYGTGYSIIVSEVA